MRNFILVSSLVIFCFCGCTNTETKRVTREQNGMTHVFVSKMDKGETTREQEQKFIKAQDKVAYEVDRAVRGIKKAQKTRLEAEAISQGIDINAPLNLDSISTTPKEP
jgi:uncharacterized lipoprotein NlpE involved in copper resistance